VPTLSADHINHAGPIHFRPLHPTKRTLAQDGLKGCEDWSFLRIFGHPSRLLNLSPDMIEEVITLTVI
jgi:hypothetical protein